MLRKAQKQERPKRLTAAREAKTVKTRQPVPGSRDEQAAWLEEATSLTEACGCGPPTRRG